ncbi:MAG: secretin and TonB N-terminal domain-containing protein [Opitutae bacterium]|nr:secretin and TonB N-terminal domain-containing protein [Opitutae bacterium]
MSTRNLLTALSALAITAIGFAQENPPAAPTTEPAKPDAVTVQGAEPVKATGSATRDKDTLSVDFPDEDIKTILRNVADLFELNLVVPDTLTGKTSIKLRDVTWRQIFQVVLSPANYSYVEEGNIIKIVSNESLTQEPTATEVFILNNAKAADIKPTVDGLVDTAGGGKILIDARSNALVVTERPSRMGRIRVIIDQLDKATDQVMIESKFVEVTDRDIRNIGVNWQSLAAYQLGVGKISQTFNRGRGQTSSDGVTNSNGTTNTTNNSNTNSNSNSTTNGTTSTTTTGTTAGNAITYVTGFDNPIATTTSLPNGQVTFPTGSVPSTTFMAGQAPTYTAVNTYTGSNTNNITNGTSGSTSNSISDTITTGLTNTATNALNSLTSLANTGSTNRLASAVFSASDFNIIISALKTLNSVKVVNNPTIVTLNNTEAFINIGQEFPIPSYTYNSERGTFEVSGFQYKPIGVILKVTPQVNARGTIKMALEPEVSQTNGTTSFGGAGGASIPIIATRKVKTQISLQSGYTAGIGGLITTQKDHGNTKVPILGDIPGLGRLFSSKSVNDVTSNLLIFITAKTVTADGASPEEVFDPRAIRASEMTRDELPGFRAPKGADLYGAPTTAEERSKQNK